MSLYFGRRKRIPKRDSINKKGIIPGRGTVVMETWRRMGVGGIYEKLPKMLKQTFSFFKFTTYF